MGAVRCTGYISDKWFEWEKGVQGAGSDHKTTNKPDWFNVSKRYGPPLLRVRFQN
jgi:hypothetical protein